MRYRRILVIVIDSIGVGGAPDASKYNSAGADTLGHMAEFFLDSLGRPLDIPTMAKLGICGTHPGGLAGIDGPARPMGAFGRMQVVGSGDLGRVPGIAGKARRGRQAALVAGHVQRVGAARAGFQRGLQRG